MTDPRLTLILPAFNEARRIAETVGQAVDYLAARRISYEIIVPADGEDGTREIVAELGRRNARIHVMGGPQRRGKGFAIRQAVEAAMGEIIGFSDADNKTPITELDKFLPELEKGWDVVIGSRGMRESVIERRQAWYRQIGSRGFGVFMHLLVGLWEISDTQCGFKFFKGSVARELFALQIIDGYMFDVEILYLAKRRGCRIRQIPIRWRDDGDTRLDLWAGNVRNFLDVARIRLHADAVQRGQS